MKATPDPKKRILLNQLPKLLRGYGKAFAGYPNGYSAAIVLVCDLDARCLKEFREELDQVLHSCDPRPETRFCIAIEEVEAWLLGDPVAVKTAYPTTKEDILNTYVYDSICGTWEKLADAVYPGGSRKLKSLGWVAVGAEKTAWAEKITPHMSIENNRSPSFRYFSNSLRQLVRTAD